MMNGRNPWLALGLAVGLTVAADAQAGMFGGRDQQTQSGRRTEKTAEQNRPRRFNRIPEMTFMRGRLALSGPRAWRLDGTDLLIRKDCVMLEGGQPVAVLEEGREAFVTGVLRGGVMEVWGLEVLSMADNMATPNPNLVVEASDSDSSVGEVISGAY